MSANLLVQNFATVQVPNRTLQSFFSLATIRAQGIQCFRVDFSLSEDLLHKAFHRLVGRHVRPLRSFINKCGFVQPESLWCSTPDCMRLGLSWGRFGPLI